LAHDSVAPVSAVDLRQFGQYHGAGVLTGFGLRLRHLAQRKRLPFTAVFGRNFFPVLGKFFAITPPPSLGYTTSPVRLLTLQRSGDGEKLTQLHCATSIAPRFVTLFAIIGRFS
jgi:hypothetical protein